MISLAEESKGRGEEDRVNGVGLARVGRVAERSCEVRQGREGRVRDGGVGRVKEVLERSTVEAETVDVQGRSCEGRC